MCIIQDIWLKVSTKRTEKFSYYLQGQGHRNVDDDDVDEDDSMISSRKTTARSLWSWCVNTSRSFALFLGPDFQQ